MNTTCRAATSIIMERGSVKVHCTLDDGHEGEHYDSVFFYAWQW